MLSMSEWVLRLDDLGLSWGYGNKLHGKDYEIKKDTINFI